MTYFQAMQCFDENSQLIGDPNSDRMMWNLSTGLSMLTEAIQTDLNNLQSDIRRIEEALQQSR